MFSPTAWLLSLKKRSGQRPQSVHPPSYNGPKANEHADGDSPLSHLPSELLKLRTPLPSIRTLLSPCPTPSDPSPSLSLHSPPAGAIQSHASFVEGSHTDVSQRGSGTTPPGAIICTSTDTNSGPKRQNFDECKIHSAFICMISPFRLIIQAQVKPR